MKKTLIALAVLGAFASAASAQSTVTLSGMLDAGIRHQGTATGYDWNMGGAGSAFNNFTLSGKEDLGGGMNAFFTMNHRFRIQNGTINSADNAAGVPTFYRNIFVGLGGAFGDVRLGRILMPLQEWNGAYDPWYGGYTVASTHTGGLAATVRANQAIYYRSPSMGGLTVHAAIAAGANQLQAETANDYGSRAPAPAALTQRPEGFAVTYAAGPLKVTAAYDKNYAAEKTTGLYGQYNFGVAILNMQYESGDGTFNGNLSTGAEKVKAFSISADIPFGAFLGKVGYLRYDSDRALKDAHKFGVGGEYAFSKRTLIYADVAKSGGDRISLSGLGAAAYAGGDKSVFDLGLRHKF